MPNINRIDKALTVGAEVARFIPTHRQCHIKITNTCSYTLCNPSVHINSGYCTDPLPPLMDSFSSGDASFTKSAYTARGAVGVFTYDLLNKSTRSSTEKIAVMFSVPYDFIMYSNWYAVGIFDKNKECNRDLYCLMYHNTDNAFVRGKASGPSLTYKGGQVTIMATMSDSYQPIIKVQVKDN